MRVGIDASCWSVQRGYGRYTRGLLNALVAEDSPHEITLVVDRQTYEQCDMPSNASFLVVNTGASPSQAAAASSARSPADVWKMSQAVANKSVDVFFFPSIYSYFPLFRRPTMLLGIHDIIAETYPDLVFPHPINRLLWNTKHWLGRFQADLIVTVSDFARQRIISRFGYHEDDVWVVGEAPNPIFRPIDDHSLIDAAFSRYQLHRDQRYLACLGGLNPHKNLGMLLDVFARLRLDPQHDDLHLLLIGPADSDLFTPGVASLREKISALGLQDFIHLTGFIEDEDVVRLLNGSHALVLPSLEEGYGLGAVEASACGIPVIATRNSPLPTLLEGGGYFIDPYDPPGLESALRQLLADDRLRRTMGTAAMHQAKRLSWKQSAQAFLALLDRVGAHEAA